MSAVLPSQPTAFEGVTARPLPRPAARPAAGPLPLARLQTILLLAPLLGLVFVRSLLFPTDPDYWWHVKTGQLILETGALPRVDVFSSTAAGEPWVTHEWLTQVLFFVVERQFGYVGNAVLFGLLVLLTVLTVYAACRLRGLGQPVAAILTLGIWASWASLANVRPQVVTALLVAVLLLLLTAYQRGHRRALWPIPPLLALWVNLHGGYIIGLALLGLTLVGETAARLLGRPAAPLRPLLLTTVLATLATLLSPHGFEALTYPFTYAGSGNASMRYIAEWQSPNFHQAHFLGFTASLLLLLLVGLWRRPLGPTELLWGLFLVLMALRSTRHIPLYGIVIAPLLAARLAAELPLLAAPLAALRRRSLLIACMWISMLLSAVGLLTAPQWRQHLQLGAQPNDLIYPSGAVEYLRTSGLQGNLFNDYVWGGYLIYQLYPERRVFIDGRADVYGDARVEQYVRVITLQPGWRQVLDDHDVRLVLTEQSSPLAVVLSEDSRWQEVYRGTVERLFVRQAS